MSYIEDDTPKSTPSLNKRDYYIESANNTNGYDEGQEEENVRLMIARREQGVF